MRISDWSSDVCSSDLGFCSALRDQSAMINNQTAPRRRRDIDGARRHAALSTSFHPSGLNRHLPEGVTHAPADAQLKRGGHLAAQNEPVAPLTAASTEERRGGKKGVRTWRSR